MAFLKWKYKVAKNGKFCWAQTSYLFWRVELKYFPTSKDLKFKVWRRQISVKTWTNVIFGRNCGFLMENFHITKFLHFGYCRQNKIKILYPTSAGRLLLRRLDKFNLLKFILVEFLFWFHMLHIIIFIVVKNSKFSFCFFSLFGFFLR